MEARRFHTAIAALMEYAGWLRGAGGELPEEAHQAARRTLVSLLAPFAPHIAEELWQRLGHTDTLAYADFPVADPALLVTETVTYPVQVNGKVRGRVEVAPDASEETVRAAALESVAEALAGREPRKVIVVAGRLVSVVV